MRRSSGSRSGSRSITRSAVRSRYKLKGDNEMIFYKIAVIFLSVFTVVFFICTVILLFDSIKKK